MDMKYYIRFDAGGNGKIAVQSNDPTITFDDSLKTIDVTNHPNRGKMLQTPEHFKEIKSVVVEKTEKEKEDFKKASLPTPRPDVVGDLQKQVTVLQEKVSILEKPVVVKSPKV